MNSTATRQSGWFVEIEGLDATWATAAAPSKTVEVTEVRDGGAAPESVAGEGTWGNVDLGRPWRVGRDKNTFLTAHRLEGQQKTATWFYKGRDGVIAERLTFLVTILGVAGPSADASSSAGATNGLTVKIDRLVG